MNNQQQYGSYSSRDASSLMPSQSSSSSSNNYANPTYTDHAVSASSQSNSYQQAAASVNQALASSGILNSLSSGSGSSNGLSGANPSSSSSASSSNSNSPSSSSSNLAYYYYYPSSKESSSQVMSQNKHSQGSDGSPSTSGGYQASNQYQSLLSFPSSSSSSSSSSGGGAAAAVNNGLLSSSMDAASSLASMALNGVSHGLGSGGLDTAASNMDASYSAQPDQYSNQQPFTSGNQGNSMGNSLPQQQQQNQYQQQYNSLNSYSDYTSPNQNGGNLLSPQQQQQQQQSSHNGNGMHSLQQQSPNQAVQQQSGQASSPSAYHDLSSYPSTLSQMSANQPPMGNQQPVSGGAYPTSQQVANSMNPFGTPSANGNSNQGQNSLQNQLNSNNMFSASELTNAYNNAFNIPNAQANDQSTTFGSLAGNSNPYASFAGLGGAFGGAGQQAGPNQPGQGFNPAQYQSNQFSSGLNGQFNANAFNQPSGQASTNQFSSLLPNQQDPSTASSTLTTTNSRRHGIASYIMPLLAVAGLSMLIPTLSQFSVAVGRKKRSIGDNSQFTSKDQHQHAKETLISEYSDKIKRYYSIYMSAVENDDCMNRLICELGDAVKEVRGKAAVVT